MIEVDDNARRAITNARALLDAMLAGGWKQACVTGPEGDYFLARDLGTPNPLLASNQAPEAQPLAPVASAPPAKPIAAPHVGTVSWLAAVGSRVADGEVVARLAVLDETVEVLSQAAGTISAQLAGVGELAEYGTELVAVTR